MGHKELKTAVLGLLPVSSLAMYLPYFPKVLLLDSYSYQLPEVIFPE